MTKSEVQASLITLTAATDQLSAKLLRWEQQTKELLAEQQKHSRDVSRVLAAVRQLPIGDDDELLEG